MQIDCVKIRSKRAELKLSQAEVADISGISQTHYSFIEQGKRIPRLDDLSGIAYALGLSISEILIESQNPPVPRKVAAKLRKSGAMSPCTAGI